MINPFKIIGNGCGVIYISLFIFSTVGWIINIFILRPASHAMVAKYRYEIQEEINYRKDEYVHGVKDYWQLPQETIHRKTGDCEDFSILLAYKIKNSLPGKFSDPIIITGTVDGNGHAWVKWKNYYYEATSGRRLKYNEIQEHYKIKKEIKYTDALTLCEAYP